YSLQPVGTRMAGSAVMYWANPRGQPASRRMTDCIGTELVSHAGVILPAGFLPLACGRFPRDSVVDVYQNQPSFVALRRPNEFQGKCGVCEFRNICGGSRSRAFALTGEPLASEPDCAFEPRAIRVAS